MISSNAMIEELGLGIVVYTNQHAVYAPSALIYQILEAYLIDNNIDWIDRFNGLLKKRKATSATVASDIQEINYTPTGTLSRYAGTYKDNWLGHVEISQSKQGLYFTSARSDRLKGKMIPYKSDILIVRWEDRTLDADAYVKYTTDYNGGPTGFTMKAVSPMTDFSFDFHDLNFERVKTSK
jgi:hypothetical protein